VARYYTPSGRSIQKPYEDLDAYYKEVDERFNNGELLGTDSTNHQNDSLVYYTLVEKRPVYAGGGIAPDIFMPLDTTYENFYVAVLRQYITPFLHTYMLQEKSSFANYTEDRFIKQYQISDELLVAFEAYASQEGFKGEFSEDQVYLSGLKHLIKANLARLLFDRESFYKVVNSESPIIDKALEVLMQD
jgi:carboxyl-terminal processing protease